MAVEIERKYLVDTVYGRRFLGNTSTRLRFNFHNFQEGLGNGVHLAEYEIQSTPPAPKMIQCLPWLVGEFGDV